MNKTEPIGVRFDVNLLDRLKEEGIADTPQAALNFLSTDFLVNHPTEKVVHIYKLINPLDKSVFYVGKTEKPPTVRLYGHLSELNNPYTKNDDKVEIIRTIIENKKFPIVQIIETIVCSCDEDFLKSKDRETFWIKKLLKEGVSLMNRERKYPTDDTPKAKKIPKEIVFIPKNLKELKSICPKELTSFDRSDWIRINRLKYGV